MFCLIWLLLDDAYALLNIGTVFREGKMVIFIIGIKFIIDMGTGVNSQLLYTSPLWRFEFLSGVVLLVFSIGLNYYLVKEYGIIGAAVAGFISLSIYNAIRLFFIWIKYKMQPFTVQTLWAILSAAACYFIVYFVFQNVSGWAGVIL